MKMASLTGRAAVVSFALLFSFLLAWHLATRGSGTAQHMDPEYAKLMGATALICSLWPTMINTAFGVASVRREWLNVAKTLEVGTLRRAFTIILPAAAPTILTGMRISIGIAWLVIVAAEMLVGGTGIGYFVWNEWNNLSITNVITAILAIGLVGMLLDFVLARLTRLVTFPE